MRPASWQIASCDCAHLLLGHFERLDSGNVHGADVLPVGLHEGVDILLRGRLADIVGNVEGEEVRSLDEPVDIGQVDVVGVNEILSGITESLDGRVGLATGLHGLGVHDLVLAVGLVPDRDEAYAEFLLGLEKGLELCDTLMGEAVADSE